MTEFDPQAAAEAVSQPGTFSFIDRLLGRNLPKDTVMIYLDEEAAFELIAARKAHANITDANDPALAELDEKITELEKKLEESKYIFHLEAITASEYDKVIEDTHEEMPGEKGTTVNPLTNEVVQYDVNNPERDELISRRIWARFIRAIEDGQGNRDEQITEQTAGLLRTNLPLAAQSRITKKITDLRMAADWMEVIQDEGFFPTP